MKALDKLPPQVKRDAIVRYRAIEDLDLETDAMAAIRAFREQLHVLNWETHGVKVRQRAKRRVHPAQLGLEFGEASAGNVTVIVKGLPETVQPPVNGHHQAAPEEAAQPLNGHAQAANQPPADPLLEGVQPLPPPPPPAPAVESVHAKKSNVQTPASLLSTPYPIKLASFCRKTIESK